MRIAIVGAGISGATIASLAARDGHSVTVFEKRDKVGGNCSDTNVLVGESEYGSTSTILKSDFGAHIFHTDDKIVWDYLNSFTPFYNYTLQVQAVTNVGVLPLPINLNTLSVFDRFLFEEFKEPFLSENGVSETFKQSILDRSEHPTLMEFLFNNLIKDYSEKQWGRKIEDIPASVSSRIPTRNTFDNRYFTDEFQGLPEYGYTDLIEKMLAHKSIDVLNNVKNLYKNSLENLSEQYDYVFYCGSLDKLFEFKHGNLEYRSLSWIDEVHNTSNVQGCPVLNDCTKSSHTRTVEWKHFAKKFSDDGFSIITKEFPERYIYGKNEPLYPITNEKNINIQKKYLKELFDLSPNVLPLGRMAQYRYYDMDDAIKEAFNLYETILDAKKKN